MENLEYGRDKEMEGVKGLEGDCVNELTVLKVHLNIKSILVFNACASLLHFKLGVFDFICFLGFLAHAPSLSLELLLLLSRVSLSYFLSLN